MSSEIKKAVLLSYVLMIVNISVGFFYTPWFVKKVGVSDYALYSLIGVFLSYFIMDFGLSDVMARFAAKYRFQKSEKINNLINISLKIYFFFSIALSVIFIVLYFFLDSIFLKLTIIEIHRFKIIYIIAGFFSIVLFPFTPLNGLLLSYEKLVFIKITDLISKISTVFFSIVLLFFNYTIFEIVFVSSLISLIVNIYKWTFFKKQNNIIYDLNYKDKLLTREIFSTSIWFTLIAVSKRLLINLSPTLLGIFSGSKQIAIFSIAMLLESYVYMFASSINGFFTARVASITNQTSDRKEVLALMIKTGRLQLVVIGIIYIGLIVLGKSFIILWMGKEFSNAYFVVLMLTVSGFFTLTQDVGNTLMYIENEIKYRALFYVASVLTSLAISFFLLSKFGAIGSGIAIGFSFLIFHFLAINWVFYKKMNLNILIFFKEVYIKMSVGLLSSFIIAIAIDNLFITSNFVFLGFKIILIVIFYILFMWHFSLNTFEKNLIRNLIKIN